MSVPLSAVYSALRDVHRVFGGEQWRVVDLVTDGDTVSLRIRFTGAAETAPSAVLRREGEYWSLDWSGATLRLRHARGLCYLRDLLSRPGVEVHALQLVVAAGGARPAAGPADPELVAGDPGDVGPLLDETAKNAYRRRLADLRDEQADAQLCHDPERASRARLEIDALTQQLAAAFGLGGRARPAGSAAERARINVTRALRTAIARIGAGFPDLGHHLSTTVRTGTFCVYQPGPRPPLNIVPLTERLCR